MSPPPHKNIDNEQNFIVHFEIVTIKKNHSKLRIFEIIDKSEVCNLKRQIIYELVVGRN